MAILLSLVAVLHTSAQSAASKEYQVKAACLFNFAQFVEWPPSAFPQADTPICIGVLGEDPFGPVLEQTIQGATINNRKLVIRRSLQVEELKSCHLLFISKSEKGRLDQILASLEGTSVLTVSETEQFAKRGGAINFFLEEQKVRFEINPAAARRHGLKISSQLLKVGKVIGRESDKEKSQRGASERGVWRSVGARNALHSDAPTLHARASP